MTLEMRMTFHRFLAAAALLLAGPFAHALTVEPYSRDAVAKALHEGKPVAMQFHADWCPTCRAQDKSLEALKAEQHLDITLFVVDFDKETELKRQLKVAAQSTIIVFRDGKERARTVGQTAPDPIRALLKTAL